MSDDLSSKCVLIADNGLNFGLAESLVGTFGRVLYHHLSCDEAYPSLTDCVIGDGFGPEVELCPNFWRARKEFDLAIFPNRGYVGEQLALESMGKRVWGSRTATEYEEYRLRLRKLQERLGMDTPDYVVVIGLKNLRKHLNGLQDKWVKLGEKFRRDFETFHYIDDDQSSGKLDKLAVTWGPFQDDVMFLVEDTIKPALELGGDWICVDGKYADYGCVGMEQKDLCYVASLRKWSDLPKEISSVYEALAPTMAECHMRNVLSTEQRVKGEWNYLTDLTPRFGFPSGACLRHLCANFPQILWRGAAGELIPFEPADETAIEAMVDHEGEDDSWREAKFDKEVLPALSLINACKSGKTNCFPPSETRDKCIGSICATGPNIKAAYEKLKSYAELMKDAPVKIRMECVAELVAGLAEAEDQGIEMATTELPDPDEVMPEV